MDFEKVNGKTAWNVDYTIDMPADCNSPIMKSRFTHYEVTNDITRLFDKYNIFLEDKENSRASYMTTYFHIDSRDIKEFVNHGTKYLAFRIPGATRGCLELQHIANKDGYIFRILSVEFYKDSCFDKLKCYRHEILDDPEIESLPGKLLKIKGLY